MFPIEQTGCQAKKKKKIYLKRELRGHEANFGFLFPNLAKNFLYASFYIRFD